MLLSYVRFCLVALMVGGLVGWAVRLLRELVRINRLCADRQEEAHPLNMAVLKHHVAALHLEDNGVPEGDAAMRYDRDRWKAMAEDAVKKNQEEALWRVGQEWAAPEQNARKTPPSGREKALENEVRALQLHLDLLRGQRDGLVVDLAKLEMDLDESVNALNEVMLERNALKAQVQEQDRQIEAYEAAGVKPFQAADVAVSVTTEELTDDIPF